MVFSKSFCPFCSKAKASLSKVLPKDKITVLEVGGAWADDPHGRMITALRCLRRLQLFVLRQHCRCLGRLRRHRRRPVRRPLGAQLLVDLV